MIVFEIFYKCKIWNQQVDLSQMSILASSNAVLLGLNTLGIAMIEDMQEKLHQRDINDDYSFDVAKAKCYNYTVCIHSNEDGRPTTACPISKHTHRIISYDTNKNRRALT